jgi:cysteine protease ATG4
MFLFKTKIIWFSYRKNFQPIIKQSKQIDTNHKTRILDLFPRSPMYNSDTGWGCMIRCSQMLLAQAIFKSYTFSNKNEVIKLFLDKHIFPFSIHNMIIEGNKFGKNPGDWYGPQMACHLIKNIYSSYKYKHLNVIISEQGILYEDDFLDNFQEKLVLIPLRLGVRNVDQCYYTDIIYFLKHHGSVGMIGGTPRHALYFVGSIKTPEGKETNKLIALDPHTVQEVDLKELNTYSCDDPKIIHMNELDPNVALGFYFRDYDDFNSLKTMVDCNKSNLITIKKTKKETISSNVIEDFELVDNY